MNSARAVPCGVVVIRTGGAIGFASPVTGLRGRRRRPSAGPAADSMGPGRRPPRRSARLPISAATAPSSTTATSLSTTASTSSRVRLASSACAARSAGSAPDPDGPPPPPAAPLARPAPVTPAASLLLSSRSSGFNLRPSRLSTAVTGHHPAQCAAGQPAASAKSCSLRGGGGCGGLPSGRAPPAATDASRRCGDG